MDVREINVKEIDVRKMEIENMVVKSMDVRIKKMDVSHVMHILKTYLTAFHRVWW